MPVFPPTDLIPPGTPGSLLTADYQYELNGVLMGAGTSFTVESITGLLGNPPTRLSDIDLQNSHGSIPGPVLFSQRIVAFNVLASSQFEGTPVDALIEALSVAFQPPALRSTLIPDVFAYQRPGRDIRQLFGRGTKLDADSDYKVSRGLVTASCEFTCPDPVSYSLALATQNLVLGTGITSGSTIVTMDGSLRNGTPPFLYISGTCTNPIVSNQNDDNRQLKLQVILASNQICRVNMDTYEVAIQTGGDPNPWVDNYTIVRDDSQFWNLLPGNNTIVYDRTGSGASSTLRIDHYDAWARG